VAARKVKTFAQQESSPRVFKWEHSLTRSRPTFGRIFYIKGFIRKIDFFDFFYNIRQQLTKLSNYFQLLSFYHNYLHNGSDMAFDQKYFHYSSADSRADFRFYRIT